MTCLCYGNVVLAPVLTQEQSFFTLEQACQVQPTDRHIDLEFHFAIFPFLFKVDFKFRAPLDNRQVT